MEREVKTYSSGLVVAAAFAQYLTEQIIISEKLNIAISGGSTPRLLFSILSEVYEDKIDWSKIHIFWVDERCVSPADEQSNYKMTSSHLLGLIPIPQENVNRVYGEDDPKLEAERYSSLIKQSLPIKGGLPIFDMILLGMGDDGHTASIFPPEINLLESENVCEVGNHPNSGKKRITLTGKVINAAKQKHFLVVGSNKEKVVSEIFTNSQNSLQYPAAHIDNAIWWLDTEAYKE